MNKIDIVIIAVPEFDSPMIRDFIHKYYGVFNKITYMINVSHDHCITDSEQQYINFITQDLHGKADVVCSNHVETPPHDWRSAAFVKMIETSNAEYIYSIEPDFVGDWDKIVNIMLNSGYSMFTNYTASPNGTVRLWPSFWGCKIQLLKQINLVMSAMANQSTMDYYSVKYNKIITYTPPFIVKNDHLHSLPTNLVNPKQLIVTTVNNPSYDHFDYVSTQIVELLGDHAHNQILLLNRMTNIWWEHMTGITHDYMCKVRNGRISRPIGVYKRFYELCCKCNVAFYQPWIDLSEEIIHQTP